MWRGKIWCVRDSYSHPDGFKADILTTDYTATSQFCLVGNKKLPDYIISISDMNFKYIFQ